MKTSGLSPSGPAHAHVHPRSNSRSNPPSLFSNRPSNTPISSPRQPHSVGQPFPPKLSPGVHRGVVQDARTPSPNYFGLTIEPTADPRETSALPRENWSSPTSSVKSFGAAIPKQLPLDANPDFEAFRRQIDANRGKTGFSLGTSQFSLNGPVSHIPMASTPSALQRPRPPPRWNTYGSDASDVHLSRGTGQSAGNPRSGDMFGSKNSETDGLQDSAYLSGDSKRNSEASFNAPSFFNMGTHESPASTESPFNAPGRGRSNLAISRVDDRHPRLSLIQGRADPPSPDPAKHQQPQHRAETVPPKLESGPGMMSPAQLRDLIERGQDASILLLDLRVSPQFAQSRVKGALNLCIPTTLLKRATFNLQKLQTTFHADQDQEKFANWRTTSHLIVYDAFSSEKRDAVSAMNMIKKFTNEGYSGSANILRGGFNAFASAFPNLVDRASSNPSPSLSLGAGSASASRVAPVLGGVMLPNVAGTSNPFFNNIRQNQDLVDGVGQMEIGVPSGLDKSRLPCWLKDAVDATDHGKKVSDKFLGIELSEQSRMRDAYSVFTPTAAGRAPQADAKVQLSGIEQGGKNRYKDILPFEHARVRLQGRSEGSCDYVNASHVQSKRSHKRYIASQGPLPATFEDFWSVIWDQDVRVIVMLTAESEGGQLKCHPYWKGKEFGSIKLRALSEKKVSLDLDKHRTDSNAAPTSTTQASAQGIPSTGVSQNGFSWGPSQTEGARRRANTATSLAPGAIPSIQKTGATEAPYVIIRKFTLSHASQPFAPIREITHLHYPSWPDFGAPAQPSHLLALVELANVMQRSALPVENPFMTQRGGSGALSWYDAPESDGNARPMLVHCSAGCGRTGTFCTVDSVIDMLKRQRLRAAQRANKRIDERERRITHDRGDRSSAKRQALSLDLDGDVLMDREISPLATPDVPGSASLMDLGQSREGDQILDEEGIDTSWVDDDTIDMISSTVEDFRCQRLSMVQSLRQFVLCYETVLEWIWRIQERSGGVDSRGRSRSGSLAM
ncbi:hypothetical protein B0H67DRAFT_493260 [Lasiosphaeris hirsuta]|uniref:protein-tyrosine-phosphatase n=1 Tax=Lasiosphaeris hirsuta TaxID=260670 RepID=A0AA40DRJ8_9PEZI|nr:hypothetical protein B0H67DRAFT_493260 [Lasiosphaeris hirsuta]